MKVLEVRQHLWREKLFQQDNLLRYPLSIKPAKHALDLFKLFPVAQHKSDHRAKYPTF